MNFNSVNALRFFLMVVFFSSCQKNTNDDVASSDPATKGYQAEPSRFSKNDIQVATHVRTDYERGEIVLLLDIENDAGAKIVVAYNDCQLGFVDDNTRVVVPEIRKVGAAEIFPGDKAAYEIAFHPINSIDFYTYTNHWGDMKKQYTLNMNFIKDEDGNALFDEVFSISLTNEKYKDYLIRYGKDDYMQIFKFDFDDEKLTAQEITYLKEIKNDVQDDGSQHAVFMVNPTITIDRMIFNVFAYKERDSLVVNMRMLNEGTEGVKIIPSKCVAVVSNRIYSAAYHFSDAFEDRRLPGEEFIFKPGTRLHLMLKYYVPERVDHWRLSNDWLMIQSDAKGGKPAQWRALLASEIQFKAAVSEALTSPL